MKKTKTIFTTKDRPYFDKKGNHYIPKNLLYGGMVDPPLEPREWMMLLLLNTNNLENAPDDIFETVGSRTTQWRVKKSLKNKGYL